MRVTTKAIAPKTTLFPSLLVARFDLPALDIKSIVQQIKALYVG